MNTVDRDLRLQGSRKEVNKELLNELDKLNSAVGLSEYVMISLFGHETFTNGEKSDENYNKIKPVLMAFSHRA
jgi:hypothetical protein